MRVMFVSITTPGVRAMSSAFCDVVSCVSESFHVGLSASESEASEVQAHTKKHFFRGETRQLFV